MDERDALARKIQLSKWEKAGGTGRLGSDVMGDLRSTNDLLSLWSTPRDDVRRAVLALATGSRVDRIGKVDAALLPPEYLTLRAIAYEQSSDDADSAINGAAQWHDNARPLTVDDLFVFVSEIRTAVSEDRAERWTLSEVRDALI